MIRKQRVIIAGGRDFGNRMLTDVKPNRKWLIKCKQQMHEAMVSIFQGRTSLFFDGSMVVISGTAAGADKLGEAFARHYNLKCEQFFADWDKHGKAAGPLRNLEMAEVGTHLMAFWDGQSRGTRSMINIALDRGLEVHVYRYEPQ